MDEFLHSASELIIHPAGAWIITGMFVLSMFLYLFRSYKKIDGYQIQPSMWVKRAGWIFIGTLFWIWLAYLYLIGDTPALLSVESRALSRVSAAAIAWTLLQVNLHVVHAWWRQRNGN